MLESYLREQRRHKDILLMTHIVIGYPSLDASFEIISTMVDAGVDLMELQIPFSEPIADGPVILRANQKALANGVTVKQCLEFADKAAKMFKIPFLLMTYYNILYKYGVEAFTDKMAAMGIRGAIVPDLPPEEGQSYLQAMDDHKLAPIFIYAPTSSLERMQKIAGYARGFIYCVARKGVTGQQTSFSNELESYLARCRKSTQLPLALGFGVKEKADVDFLKGKVDIAVIGSQTIRIVDKKTIPAAGEFLRSLRD
ncbi:MAG: tryptophan synthase subunit alpha [Desulfobacteraceae bacterium]|nr:tryptophan synthase subunit alpha [Desulfobacteraceae bacterium]